MIKLPHWVITDKFPSLYDHESGTAIEQTAKVYGAMNDLIDEYNQFVDHINTTIETFIEDTNGDYEVFKVALRQEYQNFIDVIDLKIKSQDSKIADAVSYMKTNLLYSLKSLIASMRETDELNEIIMDAFNDITEKINDETNARTESYNMLDGKINNETNARIQAINAESSARQEKDNQIDAELSSAKNEITSLKNFVSDATATHKFIILGDSYSVSVEGLINSWGDRLADFLGEENCYKGFVGGLGFVPRLDFQNSFKITLESLENSISENDKKLVSKIIVGGGYNDLNADYVDLETNIDIFVTYVKSKYPNAEIIYYNFGYTYESEKFGRTFYHARNIENCCSGKMRFYADAGLCLHNKNYFNKDKIHPNNNGQFALYKYIINTLNGSLYTPYHDYSYVDGVGIIIEGNNASLIFYATPSFNYPIVSWASGTLISTNFNHNLLFSHPVLPLKVTLNCSITCDEGIIITPIEFTFMESTVLANLWCVDGEGVARTLNNVTKITVIPSSFARLTYFL